MRKQVRNGRFYGNDFFSPPAETVWGRFRATAGPELPSVRSWFDFGLLEVNLPKALFSNQVGQTNTIRLLSRGLSVQSHFQ